MSDSALDGSWPIRSDGPRADAIDAGTAPEAAAAEPQQPDQEPAQAPAADPAARPETDPGAHQSDDAPGSGANQGPTAGGETPLAGAGPAASALLAPGAGQALLDLALAELQQKRQALEQELGELERRRDQVQREIQSSFAGQSDGIARRVKGFQDYLVGALQELAVAAEQVELVVQPLVVQPSPSTWSRPERVRPPAPRPRPRPRRACSARTNP
jgi:FtsZ-binding cell division protein ZapB